MFLTLQNLHNRYSTEKVKGRIRIRECNPTNSCILLFYTDSLTIRTLSNSPVNLCVRPITYIMCCVDWNAWYAVLYGMSFLSDVINMSFVRSFRSNLGYLEARP